MCESINFKQYYEIHHQHHLSAQTLIITNNSISKEKATDQSLFTALWTNHMHLQGAEVAQSVETWLVAWRVAASSPATDHNMEVDL